MKVSVIYYVSVDFEIPDTIATDEDALYDTLNQIDYSFDSIEPSVKIVDYWIPDFQIVSQQ